MKHYPKVVDVKPCEGSVLIITFEGGVKKRYDCSPLLSRADFCKLKQTSFFNMVRCDSGGYGIAWDDEVDIAESELWIHGIPVERVGSPDGALLRSQIPSAAHRR